MDIKRVLWDAPILTCPYDSVHRVEKGTRFQRHLIECRKNHPNVKEVICVFNNTHRIKAPEYMYHLENCPDNLLHRDFVVEKPSFDMKFKEKLPAPSLTTSQPSENWESELLPEPFPMPSIVTNKNVKFIDPSLLSGLKPKQKKKFRKNLQKGNIKLGGGDSDNEEQDQQQNRQEQQNGNSSVLGDQTQMRTVSRAATMNLQPKVPVHRPLAANPEQILNSAGRGLIPTASRQRIAANIFGGLPKALCPVTGIGRAQNIGIGRGQPIEPSVNRIGKDMRSLNLSSSDSESGDKNKSFDQYFSSEED